MKCCSCQEEKENSEFNKSQKMCRPCQSEYSKEYRKRNKEKLNATSKKWHWENREYRLEQKREYREQPHVKTRAKEYGKKYNKQNREALTKYSVAYKKERKQTDPLFKFKDATRENIRSSFKRISKEFCKNDRTEEILGCSLDEFKNHIESQFVEGMTIENHGEWHLDHIIPLATAETEEDVIRLCHYTNYQPLWAQDNWEKGDKV